ncbi:hydrogenase maturation nickel metallochaperone HypA [Mycolicibacterium gilvum]|uniref:Hydrogenase expression/synthesis, HypA n=1 Tax=Mycolicibacterium gilvum TaxID=1804 RepID=A0A378SJQ5_9MYCO|nr:hydrogenase maturation nickel metallochaperone HypA [Mycolicibacterium gilvum]MCV7059134.1 hydrogenase maturation nickel metallochaperone HypA [Mycolicibacterium gilvum]STZ43059.1 hydrogenase expression/synthesis, HypA [Mycolicibacterium gilvum]
MHEMAITQSVVDAACAHADGRRVHRVLLEIGELCALVPDSMRFCFELHDPILLCPCGSADVEVLAGRDLRILSMEVS